MTAEQGLFPSRARLPFFPAPPCSLPPAAGRSALRLRALLTAPARRVDAGRSRKWEVSAGVCAAAAAGTRTRSFFHGRREGGTGKRRAFREELERTECGLEPRSSELDSRHGGRRERPGGRQGRGSRAAGGAAGGVLGGTAACEPRGEASACATPLRPDAGAAILGSGGEGPAGPSDPLQGDSMSGVGVGVPRRLVVLGPHFPSGWMEGTAVSPGAAHVLPRILQGAPGARCCLLVAAQP